MKKLTIVNIGLSYLEQGQDLFIDGIHAQLIVNRCADQITIEGVGNGNWQPLLDTGMRIEWPIVYDTDGTPIRYNQRLRFSVETYGDTPFGRENLRGVLSQVYLTE